MAPHHSGAGSFSGSLSRRKRPVSVAGMEMVENREPLISQGFRCFRRSSRDTRPEPPRNASISWRTPRERPGRGTRLFAELHHVVAANAHAHLGVDVGAERVDAELAALGLGDIQGR